MRMVGSMSASMWIRQQPSGPNAVAIVSFLPKVAAAQRRVVCGGAVASSRLAAAICVSLNRDSLMKSSLVRQGPEIVIDPEPFHLYHYYQDYVKSPRRAARRQPAVAGARTHGGLTPRRSPGIACFARRPMYHEWWPPSRRNGRPSPLRGACHDHRSDPGKNRPGQLLRRQLPALLDVEARLSARGASRPRCAAGPGYAARPLPPHPVLPETLQVLLLPRLHR